MSVQGNNIDLSCFKISSMLSEWTLCSKDSLEITEFREVLIGNIIISSGIDVKSLMTPK